MIENEEKDLEKLLKNKISWKSVLKGIIAFILILLAYIFINFFSDFSLLGFMLLCVSSVFMIPQINEEKNNRQTISISTCENSICSVKKVQDYETGDYIFKIIGICPNCGSNLKINEIYSVKLVEKGKKSFKQKSKNK